LEAQEGWIERLKEGFLAEVHTELESMTVQPKQWPQG
jgi:hypothetical protein